MTIDRQEICKSVNYGRLQSDRSNFTELLTLFLFTAVLAGDLATIYPNSDLQAAFLGFVGVSSALALLDLGVHIRIYQIEKYVGIK